MVFYCSDVLGVFDKVDATRLLAKMEVLGVHQNILPVLASWLRQRRARIVVSGASSSEIHMLNMVYQGTVWGPPLWNCFYADARKPIATKGFTEVIFADDLNAVKNLPKPCA